MFLFSCTLPKNSIDACCYGHGTSFYPSHLILLNCILNLMFLQHDALCVTTVHQKKTMPSEQTPPHGSLCAHVIMVLFACCYETPGGAPDGCRAQTNTRSRFLLLLMATTKTVVNITVQPLRCQIMKSFLFIVTEVYKSSLFTFN